MRTVDRTEEQFNNLIKTLSTTNPSVNVDKITEAYNFAKEAHGDQKRKDGSPFVSHPLAAAQIIAEMGLDEESVIAAMLHDSIEDTPVTHEDIAKKFGDEVAEIVEGVTKLTRVVWKICARCSWQWQRISALSS